MALFNPPLGANCAACPFAKNNRPPHQPVLGEGPVDARGILIGEGPGETEVQFGRPFVGATGDELNKILTNVGLKRSELFVTNATCCKPPPRTQAKQLKAAVRACNGRLQNELERRPKAPILTLGEHAWAAITKVPKGKVGKGRGFVRELPDGRSYIATWHPTYAIFRAPYEWANLEVDIARFKRMVTGRLRAGPTRLTTQPSMDDLYLLCRQQLPVGVDLETAPEHPSRPWTGKDPTRAKIRTIGLGTALWGLSVVWDEMTPQFKEGLRHLLRARHTVWHNGVWFDHRILKRYGFEIGPFDDTRDMRRALSPTSPLSLLYLASIYDDCGPWKQSDEDDEKGLVFTDDMETLKRYNAQDCVETVRAYEGLITEPEWRTERVHKLYTQSLRLSEIAANMHTRGILVSETRRKRLARFCGNEYRRRLQKLIEKVNIPGFEGKPNHMRALIYKSCATEQISRFNLPDPWDDAAYSETGQIKVDQRNLLILVSDPSCPPELREIIDLYWQANNPEKARQTYLDSEKVLHAIGADGRLRPGWNSAGTDTGRWSCSEPNVMNLSNEKE